MYVLFAHDIDIVREKFVNRQNSFCLPKNAAAGMPFQHSRCFVKIKLLIIVEKLLHHLENIRQRIHRLHCLP